MLWLTPHPTNANILYASVIHTNAGGIYITSNLLSGASSTWTRLAVPPRAEGHPLSVHVLRDNSLACSYSGRRDPTGTFTHIYLASTSCWSRSPRAQGTRKQEKLL